MDHPHAIEHEGCLYVVFASAMMTVVGFRVGDLDECRADAGESLRQDSGAKCGI